MSLILLQETHSTNSDKIEIYGFSLVGAIHHTKHGIATLVRNDLSANLVGKSPVDSEMQWLAITINDDITIVNVYKPPRTPFQPLPTYNHPAIYSGDFNCHHTSWGYSTNDSDGDALHDWTHTIDIRMLYDHKQPKTFHSAVWGTNTNPDLTFYSHIPNSISPHPVHKVCGSFPRSQHRPTIICHPTLVEYTPTTRLPR